MDQRVVIIGGGVAGLATAYQLHRDGIPFVVLESRDRAGGVVLSEEIDGFTIDGGPDGLLVQKPEGIALCQELGLGDRLVPTKPPRLAYIQRGHQLHALPAASVLGIPTRIGPFLGTGLFSIAGKLRMGMELLVFHNPEAQALGINPFDHGSQVHTDMWKTQGLKQALDKHGFDVAFGGARRDEEKSRAKERIFSFRTATHHWDPKNQRPELWRLYNARKNKGESIRVFPISNWTELDIWQYIHLEQIPIVPLYFSDVRPVVERDGALIMVDDERMPLRPGETPMMKSVRFRTLGCYPLTGAVESTAATLPEIIQEMLLTTTSERQGRMIDHDSAASMEKKKQEGYF